MSKLGKKPISLPEEVMVTLDGNEIKVKGPKGELSLKIPHHLKVEVREKDEVKKVQVERTSNSKNSRAFHGLYRSLINNMVEGVSKGYEKKLELHGIGYQATLANTADDKQKLVLMLGFSHPVEVVAPDGITFVASKHSISISGIDKQLVGQVASSVRAFRPPEPYKGKGVRFAGEKVKKKAGKAVIKTTGA